ncbi:MAG: rhomboid family intramembrane serine protease [Bacteroidetes bacterium B1(2017)]|nr:MAG: rhomboid family intramembrane serine protease [Bacteroidetes bacterium B1(2017)]
MSEVNLIIVVITAIISIQAFSNSQLMHKLIFNPYTIAQRKEWYRFISSGFLHADWMHLGINMFVLFNFGSVVIHYYSYFFGLQAGPWMYLVLYISSIAAANATTYYRNQHNPGYNSLGASGAVSAIVFVSILFEPMTKFYFGIPGFLFGIAYLAYSQYAAQRSGDNINHEAHLYGAIYGIVFTLVFKPQVFKFFLSQF